MLSNIKTNHFVKIRFEAYPVGNLLPGMSLDECIKVLSCASSLVTVGLCVVNSYMGQKSRV
jgi:hypothetical protein